MKFPTNKSLDDLCKRLENYEIDLDRFLAAYLQDSQETDLNNLVGRSAEIVVETAIRNISDSVTYPIEFPLINGGLETEHYRFSKNDDLIVYRKDSGRIMGHADIVIKVDGLPAMVEVKTDRKLLRSQKSFRGGVLNALREYFSHEPAYVLVIPNDDYSSWENRQKANDLMINGAKIVHLPISRNEFRQYVANRMYS